MSTIATIFIFLIGIVIGGVLESRAWRKKEDIGDIFKKEFGDATLEEQKKFSDFHETYCKRKIMEAAERDPKVRERLHKAAEILRKNKSEPKT